MTTSANTPWFAVLNPASGGGRGLRQRARIERLLREAGIDYRLTVSEYAGQAIALAREAARGGCRRFICIGGDGTLNEVLNGALEAGAGETTLALIPVGRGDDWARTFGIPRDFELAVRLVAAGHTRQQDVGAAVFDHGGAPIKRHFINVAGVGFDAYVVQRTRALRLGPLTYLAGLLQGFLTFRAPRLKVTAGAFVRDDKMFLAFAAVGRYCGGGMQVAPAAIVDDGEFEVVTVGEVTKWELVVNLHRLFDGTLPEYDKVKIARAAQLRVEAVPAAQVEADGELLGQTPVTFSVLPRAIRVVVPR
jgi:YegS/Rv2252/BmrU family lipid kinase